jgi:hypothetical protein
MRTTVEITEAQRGELLRLAAQRGEKGFSRIVQEALDAYLKGGAARASARERALAVEGSLKGKDGAALADEVRRIHEHWR